MAADIPYFELNFRPNVALVSVVRRFVSEFYQRFLGDPDGTSRVALATHELLENAVKYSKDGETTIRIAVSNDSPRQVSITLFNRAEPRHLAEIREIIDGVNAATDPHEFYQQLLMRRAKRVDGSGLGLARVCAEGEMTLRYTLGADDAIEIQATTFVGS